jgi:hypothetical protein
MAASDREALPELLASEQKIEEDLAALTKSVADQQEQMKTIVDQLTALTLTRRCRSRGKAGLRRQSKMSVLTTLCPHCGADPVPPSLQPRRDRSRNVSTDWRKAENFRPTFKSGLTKSGLFATTPCTKR